MTNQISCISYVVSLMNNYVQAHTSPTWSTKVYLGEALADNNASTRTEKEHFLFHGDQNTVASLTDPFNR